MARTPDDDLEEPSVTPIDDFEAFQNLHDNFRAPFDPLAPMVPLNVRELEHLLNEQFLREQMQQIEEPQQQNMLSSPMQVASLPGAFAVDPVAQAVQAAKAVNAPPQTFEAFLADVPVEQAREMEQAYLDQQNLAAAIAAMQANIDDFANAQLEGERAALEEQDQLAAMNNLASAFGIGMEGATPDMGRAGMVAAWGNPADDWAESVYSGEEPPGTVSTPFGVAMGMLGENVDVNPLSGQFGPMSQQQMASFAEEDPFGEDPFSNAEPAFSEPLSNVASFASPALAQAVAQAQVEQAMAANELSQMQSQEDAEQAVEHSMLEGVFGDEPAPANVASLQHDPFGFTNMGSMQAMQAAAMEAAAQEQAANMANIGLSPEDMDDQAAQEQAANLSNIGLSPAGMQAAAAQDSYMSALAQAAQIAEDALSPEAVAEVDAAVANLAASLAGVPEEQAIQTMMEAFTSLMSEAQEDADNAQAADAMGAAVSPAQGMMTSAALSPAAMGAAFGPDPFSSAVSIDDPAVASSLSEMSSESDEDTSPVGVAAQSMAAANAAFGPDPFSDALGLDTLGFSDPMSDPAASAMSDPASISDPSDSESNDVGLSLGAMEAGLSAADMGAADAAPSDPGGDAGAGADSGAGADAGASGDGGGGTSDGGPTGSATGGDPDAWASGGRVSKKPKGLGAPLNGARSNGLAAMPEEKMHEPEMKVSKADAQYQNKPRGRAMCGNCSHFMPEQGGCEIVKGRISPEGWSSYFDPA